MAIEEVPNPWLYADTAVHQGYPVWYCLNPVAWTDVQRKAQNDADQTGRTVLIAKGGPKITHQVSPDEVRYAALHAHFKVEPE